MILPHKEFVSNGADQQKPIYFGVLKSCNPRVVNLLSNINQTSTNSQDLWVSKVLTPRGKRHRCTTGRLRGPVENLVHGTLHLQQLPHLELGGVDGVEMLTHWSAQLQRVNVGM